MTAIARVLPSLALLALGCGQAAPGRHATALAGAPELVDVADHECRVVLRRADAVVDAAGAGVTVVIDVADALLADPGAAPGLLARADADSAWSALDAAATTGAPAGFARFAVRLPARDHADLVAFAVTPTAVRLFDHNRVTGDLDAFHVDASSGWTIPDDAATCPGQRPVGRLEFGPGYVQTQHGAIVAGARLAVDYDLSRLTACRATHNGFRAWTLDAFARFSPGGETATGTVVASNGFDIFPVPFSTDVPAGATSVALWFRNAALADCEAWDSSFGRNYRFAVVASAPAAPGWAGRYGGSTSRACTHADTLRDPIVIDEYARERACLFVDGDVWVPGVTDAAPAHVEWLQAQAEWSRDDGAPVYTWLEPVGVVGHDARFRWSVPYELRSQTGWSRATVALRFSTDGVRWLYADGGARRTLIRAFELPGGG
jgi:hypothetical protein